MFEQKIESLKEEIIQNTCNLIKIPSVFNESNNINKPFGDEINNALEYTLNLGKSLGFKTKNIDGYCGYIEFGEGEELVGIVGHLDVVPIGEGWIHDPFKAQIEDGKIYGRGAIDDKGPVIASIYAMKTVMDTVKVNKRVRLILGTNEERDWKCINYYKEHEEIPSIGFSPDANFPCIYAEKGIETLYIESKYNNNDSITIENIDCKNNAINVVPKYCRVDLKVNNKDIDIKAIIKQIEKYIKENTFNIKIIQNENNISIISNGISSHAAYPELGKNAIAMMIIILDEIFKLANIDIKILNFIKEKIGMEINGESIGLDLKDESGILTINIGNFKLEDNKLKIGLNLRIPVKTSFEYVENKFKENMKNINDLEIKVIKKQESLYVPKDSYLVSTLNNVFNKVTNRNDIPITTGGGTYARAFKNFIAFGATMPNDQDMCHQIDEYIEIDNLILTCKIYAQAIYELSK